MDLSHKISVIVPVYNVAQWLPRCVDSILAQSYQDLEILLIDDGSTDESGEIVDIYAEKDSRIVAVHQTNAGLVAVREKGIKLATGEFVSFVDGDDVIEPDFLERLLRNAIHYNADISHCGMKFCFYDGRMKLHYGTGEIIEFDNLTGVNELLRGGKIEPSLCNKLYRRELLKDSCLDTSVTNNEDLLRNYILFSRANKSAFEDFCGYQYWRRAESMSNSGFKAKVCKDVLRARFLVYEDAGPQIKVAASHSYINALISCYNSAIGTKNDDAKEIRCHCKNELKRLKPELHALPSGLYLRAFAILNLPVIYHPLQRLHVVNVHRRIKKATANNRMSICD